jgi:hypothetical protein
MREQLRRVIRHGLCAQQFDQLRFQSAIFSFRNPRSVIRNHLIFSRSPFAFGIRYISLPSFLSAIRNPRSETISSSPARHSAFGIRYISLPSFLSAIRNPRSEIPTFP